MPMLPTPAHGSFPSAHATEAFAVAEVIKRLIGRLGHYSDIPKRTALIDKLAERIAVNRTVAGLHYPIDTWAGAILGRAVGQIVVAKCAGRSDAASGVHAYAYDAKGDSDFFIDRFLPGGTDEGVGITRLTDIHIDPSDIFGWLWRKAVSEFELT